MRKNSKCSVRYWGISWRMSMLVFGVWISVRFCVFGRGKFRRIWWRSWVTVWSLRRSILRSIRRRRGRNRSNCEEKHSQLYCIFYDCPYLASSINKFFNNTLTQQSTMGGRNKHKKSHQQSSNKSSQNFAPKLTEDELCDLVSEATQIHVLLN